METSVMLSPQEAIQRLMEGNQRFVTGVRAVAPMLAHLKMANLAALGQKPFAVVLTCSDSRSPAELIFDQGVGDLFVVRVAGNVVAPSLLASVEFAVANFGSSTVLVLGHTLCGAVSTTIDHAAQPHKPLLSSHLEELIGRIRPAVDAIGVAVKDEDRVEYIRRATLENIRQSMRLLVEQSKVVRDAVAEGKLSVEGAILDIATGSVSLVS